MTDHAWKALGNNSSEISCLSWHVVDVSTSTIGSNIAVVRVVPYESILEWIIPLSSYLTPEPGRALRSGRSKLRKVTDMTKWAHNWLRHALKWAVVTFRTGHTTLLSHVWLEVADRAWPSPHSEGTARTIMASGTLLHQKVFTKVATWALICYLKNYL